MASATVQDAAEGRSLLERARDLTRFRTPLVWHNLLGFVFLYSVGFSAYFWLWHRMKGLTFAWMWFLVFASSMGITMGAHRLWSHRSYRAGVRLRLVLAALQTMAGQNCIYIWCRDHRQHHKYSDTDADPHNSRRGFFFSHVGWLMMRKVPEVFRAGPTIDMSDLEADRIVMFQKRGHVVCCGKAGKVTAATVPMAGSTSKEWLSISGMPRRRAPGRWYKSLYLLFAIAFPVAVPILLWGEDPWVSLVIGYISRYITQLNITWLVNSWAHFFGTKPYDKNQRAVESKFVTFVTVGEGWHNYHHSFPWDYKAAELGDAPFDLTTALIELAARHGWAWGLKTAPRTLVRRRALSRGDGTHPVWGKATRQFPEKVERLREATVEATRQAAVAEPADPDPDPVPDSDVWADAPPFRRPARSPSA